MLERLGVFLYKGLVWLFLGVVTGTFIAQMQGFLPLLFIVVYVLGSIGLGAVFALLFIRYTDRKSSRISEIDQVYEAGSEAPARIDSIHFGGVRLLEARDLMIIRVTVFSRYREPYQTTVRQFMTAADLEQLESGDGLVIFYEDAHDPGYGTVLPKAPAAGIRADYKSFRAEKIYPERHKTGLLLLVGRNPNVLTRSASFVLISALFGFGFLSPYVVTGNLDWLRLRIEHFPQKLIFQGKGNFNPEAFKRAYDKAIEHIGDQRIESLLFYKDFTNVRVERTDKPGYFGNVTIRGNSVGAHFMTSRTDDQDRLFTADSIQYDLFKKALDDAATDHKIQNIMYIGVRKGIRWGTRDGRIPPDYKQDHIDIHIVFEGGNTSLHYNGETGERLPR